MLSLIALGAMLAQQTAGSIDFELPEYSMFTKLFSNGGDLVAALQHGSTYGIAPEDVVDRLHVFRLRAGSLEPVAVHDVKDARTMGITSSGEPITVDRRTERYGFPWGSFDQFSVHWSSWRSASDGLRAGFVGRQLFVCDPKSKRMASAPWETRGADLTFIADELWALSNEWRTTTLAAFTKDARELWRHELKWNDWIPFLDPLGAASVVPLDANRALVFGKRVLVASTPVWRIESGEFPESAGGNTYNSAYVGIATRDHAEVEAIGVIHQGFPAPHPIPDPQMRNTMVAMEGGKRVAISFRGWLYIRPVPAAK